MAPAIKEIAFEVTEDENGALRSALSPPGVSRALPHPPALQSQGCMRFSPWSWTGATTLDVCFFFPGTLCLHLPAQHGAICVPGLQREGIRRDTKQNFLRIGILDVRKDVGSPSSGCLKKQTQAWGVRIEQGRLPAEGTHKIASRPA